MASDMAEFLAADANERYRAAAAQFGPAIARLANGYEANPATRQDLVQEIHMQLWRSMDRFAGQCAVRTWVYRVAHNVAADHVAREKRWRGTVSLDSPDVECVSSGDGEAAVTDRLTLGKVVAMVRRLRPLDRQVMLLYLEGEDGATTGAVTGLTPAAVATRISRIKAYLAREAGEGRAA